MNLCLPYATVYMLSFGMSDVQVGIVTSIYMFSQMISAFLSGAVTDKLGEEEEHSHFRFSGMEYPQHHLGIQPGLLVFCRGCTVQRDDEDNTCGLELSADRRCTQG